MELIAVIEVKIIKVSLSAEVQLIWPELKVLDTLSK